VIETPVAAFEREAPVKRLGVVDHGFSFDGSPPVAFAGHRIPGSSITGRWQRHFGPPAKTRMESGAESLQQPRMSGVADRITLRERTSRNDETEGDRQTNERAKGYVRGASALDAADFGVGDTRGCLEGTLAEPGTHSCVPKLAAEHEQAFVSEPIRSVVWSLAGGHARMVGAVASLRIDWELRGHEPDLGASPGPNVDGDLTPTPIWAPTGRSSRRLARPTSQAAGNASDSRRLARRTSQAGRGRPDSRRLAHPTSQAGRRRPDCRRLARPTSQAGGNTADSPRLARPTGQKAQLDRRGDGTRSTR
jgi:hypothetical protein